MPYSTPPDGIDLIVTFILSVISGTVSIARRILQGQPTSWLWVVSEFLIAILCGYLMYDAYGTLEPWLPKWVTLPVAVAVAAHSGGRIFQESEETLIKFVERLLGLIK